MSQIDFKEILEYGLRSQLSHTINRLGWSITEQLRLRTPNTNRLFIQEVRNSEINVIVELDDATKTQWIAVRGSSNLKNWVLNFRYLQRSFDKNFSDRKITIDLPPGTLLTRFQGGYHHFGERILLDPEKDYPNLEEIQHLDNYTYGFWVSLLQAIAKRDLQDSTDNIKDHNLSLYLLNIINNIESKELVLTNLLRNLSPQVPGSM